MERQIKNNNKDINYIEGADYSYSGKESTLADEICKFLKIVKFYRM